MAAVSVSSSPPTRRAYSESHPRHPFRSPLGHVTRHVTNHVTPPTVDRLGPSTERGRRLVGRREEVSVGECEGEDVSVVRGRREEGGGGGEGSGESTAEEGDVIPNESSTTTDTLPEPIDFIDAGHSIPRAYSTSVLPLNGTAHAVIAPASLQGYENWSMLVQMEQQDSQGGSQGVAKTRPMGAGSRGFLLRKGKVLRGGVKERQRQPHPAPRLNKLKNQHTRPVPITRKRRFSGRQCRPSHSVSEGDMAMADEMGEGEGEGGDDGFVDCAGREAVKRRNKKRGGGLHVLIPTMGQGNTASPPSSPSNTPISSRRRTSSRKSRLKLRPRKSTKQSKPASADISTQETTTPGPNSSDTSDTDSHDETHPNPSGGDTCDYNRFAEDHHHHQSNASPPKLPSALSDSSSHISGSEASGGLEYSSALEDAPEMNISPNISPQKGTSVASKGAAKVDNDASSRVPQNGVSASKFNSDENLQRDSNETSDTDRTSLPPPQYSSSVQRKLRSQWCKKRFDSDFSTAPLSSETSDMDTSGHEKFGSDRGSTGDLTSLSCNSRNDPSSDALPSSSSYSASATAESVDSKKKDTKAVSPKFAAHKNAVTATTASPPLSKRPLKASLSSPLRNSGRAVPKMVSSMAESRSSLMLRTPPKPKPPVAAKPAVKPKPPILSSVARSGGNSPPPPVNQRKKLFSCSSSDAGFSPVPINSNHSKSEQRLPVIGGPSKGQSFSSIRKASSDTNVLKSPPSPTFVSRKLSNVCEESEDKEGSSEQEVMRPAQVSATPRPQLLPTKSKLPVSSVLRRHSPTPPPKPKPLYGSSPSASDTPSSLPSSPFAVKRKPPPPQKPNLLSRKPGILHQSASTGALLAPFSKDSSAATSPTADQKSATAGGTDYAPPPKPHTKRRPYGRETSVPVKNGRSPDASPSATPSVSPTPPLLPPHSPILEKEQTRSSESLSAVHQTPSSSSQEEAPSIPRRKKSDTPPGAGDAATTPSQSTENDTLPPPVLRRLKPSQGEEAGPSRRRVKSPPQRRPPSPPLSPSPPPLPAKSVGRSSTANTWTTDPVATNRHSLFSSSLSTTQISEVSQSYEVFDATSEENKQLKKLYQKSIVPTNGPTTEAHKKPDVAQHETSPTTARRKPRYCHYEMTFLDPVEGPTLLKNMSESSSAVSSECVPPPLPSTPIPKKKDRSKQTLLKRGPIKVPSHKSDDGMKSDTQSASSAPSAWGHPPSKDRAYEMIDDLSAGKTSKPKSGGFFRRMTRKSSVGSNPDLRSEPSFRRETKSFSTFMFRRSNSDRFKKCKLANAPNAGGSAFTVVRKSVRRTSSVDKLDDRMERSVNLSTPKVEGESSSDEEEETALSPTQQGLPQVPRYTEPPKADKRGNRMSDVVGIDYVVPADEEPLYQYINTAEFLRTPQENVKPGLTKNQLDIARQLSSRRLWCEQPEIIKSGLLEDLSEDEKKLQEAMFEVVTTEATYLRSLDVLIDHFMEDPGMNPYLPEGRRVLDKRQHHVIFSNVQEVREISARFLEELRARQNETAIIKGIADIVLDYTENKFDCYVRYCTNQIYQTRELQECLEKNTMFRDYLRRLEQHKRCQHLSMQSFLLLPMQRITRLPLLILAILNKTPLDHKDHGLVERALRTVQKLVTECNDGARKMERTEQLHLIHQQLDFGKLKPFPLVSVSRQLERKGTIMRLRVEQTLFGRHQIKQKQMYLFVFTDIVIITKRKKDPKGEYVYKVVDYASRAVVEMEDIGVHPGMSFPKHTFGEQDTVANATWAVSTAGERHAFLLILLDNVNHLSEKYICVAQNDTDKTRWMESLATPESQREDEKIYQTWDCPQVQAIYDYKAAQPDELSLERGDVVKVYRKMADGWYEGERLRDLQWGWFPNNFTQEIENEHTRARNLRETHRLLSLQYNPEEYAAKVASLT